MSVKVSCIHAPFVEHSPAPQKRGVTIIATITTTSQQLLAQHLFQYHANHIYKDNGVKETIDSMLAGPTRHVWVKSLSNEWGQLAQGNDNGVTATNTIEFIHKHEVPSERDVTYATFVLDHRPLKTEEFRIRIMVGGNRLSYEHDSG